VPLRDSWAAESNQGAKKPAAPAAKRSEPKPPMAPKAAAKEPEPKAPPALTDDDRVELERLRPLLQPVLDAVLAAHPAEVERYRGGKAGLLGFLVAQAMKRATEAGVAASPRLVNALLTEAIAAR